MNKLQFVLSYILTCSLSLRIIIILFIIKQKVHSDEWSDLYQNGAGNEIYAKEFSKWFHGMTFTDAAK